MDEIQKSPDSESLIEFPCHFPFKIIGDANDHFVEDVVSAIVSIVPDFDSANIHIQFSSRGKYASISCDVFVSSKAELDEVYQTLHQIPGIRFLL